MGASAIIGVGSSSTSGEIGDIVVGLVDNFIDLETSYPAENYADGTISFVYNQDIENPECSILFVKTIDGVKAWRDANECRDSKITYLLSQIDLVFKNDAGDWDASTNSPDLIANPLPKMTKKRVSIAGEFQGVFYDVGSYIARREEGTDYFELETGSVIDDAKIALQTTYSSQKIQELLLAVNNNINLKYDKTGGTISGDVNIASGFTIKKDNIDLKDIEEELTNKTINLENNNITQTTINPLNEVFANGDKQEVLNNKTQGQIDAINTSIVNEIQDRQDGDNALDLRVSLIEEELPTKANLDIENFVVENAKASKTIITDDIVVNTNAIAKNDTVQDLASKTKTQIDTVNTSLANKIDKVLVASGTLLDSNGSGGLKNSGIQSSKITTIEAEQLLQNKNGFQNRTSSTLSFDNLTRTFTFTPTATCNVFINGIKKNIDTTFTVQIADTVGMHYIYFDIISNVISLKSSTSFNDDFFNKFAYVSNIYWNGSYAVLGLQDERHGFNMSGATHKYLHLHNGTIFKDGLITSINVDGDGSNDNQAQFSMTSGVIADEDIEFNINSKDFTTHFPVLYRLGAGIWQEQTTSFISLSGANSRAVFNENVAGNYQLTEITSGNYGISYILVGTAYDTSKSIFVILGNSQFQNISLAHEEVVKVPDLTGLPFAEFKIIASVIYQTKDNYTNSIKTAFVSANGTPYIDWRTFTYKGVVASGSDIVDIQNQIDALDGIVNQEPIDRENADLNLQNQIDTINSNLSSVENDVFLLQEEQTIQNTNIQDNATAISNEATARQEADDLKEDKANKNQNGGYAGLDSQGLININQIPKTAIAERITVADEVARFNLTTNDIQNGDFVYQNDIQTLFYVIDENNLDNASGYDVVKQPVDFSSIQNKPTTIDGYGITDAYTKDEVDGFVDTLNESITSVSNGDNVKKYYISGGVNGTGSDTNSGWTEASAFSTLSKLNSVLDNSGQQVVFLPTVLTESATFNQLNAEFSGSESSLRGFCGTTGTITSNNNTSGSQTYKNLSLGNFVKSGAGYVRLKNLSITGNFIDSTSGLVRAEGLFFENTSVISITGSGMKVFKNQDSGIFNINNANATVVCETSNFLPPFSLTAGTFILKNATVVVPQGTTLTIGATGTIFLANNVSFLYPDLTTQAKIKFASGSFYSLQGGCVHDKSMIDSNGTDISSNYQEKYSDVYLKVASIKDLQINNGIQYANIKQNNLPQNASGDFFLPQTTNQILVGDIDLENRLTSYSSVYYTKTQADAKYQYLIIPIASESAMLSLTGIKVGYIVKRTDLDNQMFQLNSLPASTLSNWGTLGGSGTGGGGAWGEITGTLSNQTDLQNALNSKENTITAGTTSQYFRGDKTFQTLDKTAVGLSNVDNTSDANKPISTATQTALDLKLNKTVSTGSLKLANNILIENENTGGVRISTFKDGTNSLLNIGDTTKSDKIRIDLNTSKTTLANQDITGNLTLSSKTANTVPVLDANKNLVSSAITTTELGYLAGMDKNIKQKFDDIGYASGSVQLKLTTTLLQPTANLSNMVIYNTVGSAPVSLTNGTTLTFLRSGTFELDASLFVYFQSTTNNYLGYYWRKNGTTSLGNYGYAVNPSGTYTYSPTPAKYIGDFVAGDTIDITILHSITGNIQNNCAISVKQIASLPSQPRAAFQVALSAGYTVATAFNIIPYNTILRDTAGKFNTTAYSYTIPYEGWWDFVFTLMLSIAASTDVSYFAELRVNGSAKRRCGQFNHQTGSSHYSQKPFVAKEYLLAGDVVTFWSYTSSSNTALNSSNYTHCTGVYLGT